MRWISNNSNVPIETILSPKIIIEQQNKYKRFFENDTISLEQLNTI